ncbi:MOFRL family protein [Halorubrum gandharaense]
MLGGDNAAGRVAAVPLARSRRRHGRHRRPDGCSGCAGHGRHGARRDREGLQEARAALADDDAYTFLDDRGALLRPGPTGTNVNDLRVTVIAPPTE